MGEQQVMADAGRKTEKYGWKCWTLGGATEEGFLAGVRSITEEIPQGAWDAFFATFTRLHQTRLVTIEQVGPDMAYRMRAKNEPLAGIAIWTTHRGHAILIDLGAAAPVETSSSFAVSVARHVWLKHNERGADEALEIEAADGTVTMLYLRPPMPVKEEEDDYFYSISDLPRPNRCGAKTSFTAKGVC